MAYILTPRFAQAYQAPQCSPFGFCASTPGPSYGYRTVQRPQSQPLPSPFASFFSQLENLVSDIDRESHRQAEIEAQREAQHAAQIEAQREAYQAHIQAQRAAYRQRHAQIEAHMAAQREAHRQQQLRKRALRAQFAVTQNEQGWQVEAEVPGFEQENISIEVTDENSLKIAGNTEWGTQPEVEIAPAVEQSTEQCAGKATEEAREETVEEQMEGITLEPSAGITIGTTDITEQESVRPTTPDSDTSSHKSYQATVEDDFEDLGPEASTLFSMPSASATPPELKVKERAVETAEDPEISVPTETTNQQSQSDVSTEQHETEERPHGSFERTYRFPERIDADNVRASFKDGKLTINVPKAQAQQVKRISIL